MSEPKIDAKPAGTAPKMKRTTAKNGKPKTGHIVKLPKRLSFEEAVKLIFEEDGPLLKRLAD